MKLQHVKVGTLATIACALVLSTALAQTEEATRVIHDVDNSGQVGTATVVATSAGSTQVKIALKGAPADSQGVGIIRDPTGNCKTPPKGGFAFNLSDVENGASQATLPVSRDQLLSGDYFVIVYSKKDPSHYYSCGKLAHTVPPTPAPDSSGGTMSTMAPSAAPH